MTKKKEHKYTKYRPKWCNYPPIEGINYCWGVTVAAGEHNLRKFKANKCRMCEYSEFADTKAIDEMWAEIRNQRKDYKKELYLQLQNKKYRQAFVESHINNGIPFQIRTMRNNRNLKQEDLGRLAGMKQETICRLENPNYCRFTLKTLKKIADAIDVALIVRFVPFSELVRWDLNLSADSLGVPSFDQDNYFKENGDYMEIMGECRSYKNH